MNRFVTFVALLMLPLAVAQGQEPNDDRYPVTVGFGGGFMGMDVIHAMALVGVTPPGWPVGLRLDGIWRESEGRSNTDLLSSASASAVITLRPWLLSPYLIVGATRTSEYVILPRGSFPLRVFPAETQLSGGLGVSTQAGRARIFIEMREMQNSGTPITLGVSF
jgi:hypothetical protein